MPFDRLFLLGLVIAGSVLSAVAAPVGAEVREYEETCEASAAVALDDRHFAVANDETTTIAIYERGKPQPISRYVLPVDVTDIEAAARIGDTVFWLTSHSLTKAGKDKPERKLLLATTITQGQSLAMAGQPYTELRQTLARSLAESDETRSEAFNANLEDRFNIEGLAAMPDGRLLVGLRGPLTEAGKALVIALDDPFKLVGLPRPVSLPAGAPGQTVFRLDLVGRGIRSMERVGDGARAYLIAAGPEPDGGLDPLLFWWDGTAAKGPATEGPATKGTATKGPDLGLPAGVVPEALVAWSPTHVQLLGDNSDQCTDKPKFKGRKWFSTQEITLGR